MITKHFIKIIVAVSIVSNIALVCYLIQPLIAAESSIDNMKQNNDNAQIINNKDEEILKSSAEEANGEETSLEDKREIQIYNNNKPLFYGKWKIVEQVSAEFAQPSYISGFYEDGTFRGPDTSTILGMEITFALDCVEYSGKKFEYACKPRTYSHSLSEDTEINFNYAKTLGITGNYYSVVEFLLPGHDRISGEDEPKKVKISDIRNLYLKDKDTIYANAYYGITYKLERISD